MSIAPSLVQDARAGDQQAFIRLVQPLRPAAYRLAVGMLRSETEAEDAVQEAVLKAHVTGAGASAFKPIGTE